MTPNVCSTCRRECPGGVGLSFTAKHPYTQEWIQWRLCRACAAHEGELQGERARRADEQAERSGV
jgi:hypothetical protein